jgi:hypothetical protein
LDRLELTVEAQPLAKLVRAWFQLLSVGRHEHSEEALPST